MLGLLSGRSLKWQEVGIGRMSSSSSSSSSSAKGNFDSRKLTVGILGTITPCILHGRSKYRGAKLIGLL